MKHKTILIFLTLILSFSAFCRPARKGIIPLMQPDGTVFDARMKGDEFFRVTTTLDGSAIVQDKDGWWCYSTFDDKGHRYSSGWRVGEKTPMAILTESRFIPYEFISAAASERRRLLAHPENIFRLNPCTKGDSPVAKHGIVILAQFSDVGFTFGKQDFMDLLNQEGYSRNGAEGSAKEYFDDQFAGKVDFRFDVSEIITLPGTRAEYGANLPDGMDKDPARMIVEACQAADDKIDFSLYDDDNDGEIDNVFIFFAGGDEAEGAGEDCIWSHSWYILEGAEINVQLDGKQLDRYACCSELKMTDGIGYRDKTITGIGTFCHEYSHTLGLADLYDTDYEGSGGESAGVWIWTSLMDGGNQNNFGNTPPYYNAIEREMLGICEPVRITSDGSYSLGPLDKTNTVYRIDTDHEDEYYLLECRSGKGWDAYIGGQGMLVYHIDRSDRSSGYSENYGRVLKAYERWEAANEVNCRPDHQCADLLEADGRNDIFSHDIPADISGVFFPQYGATTIIPDSTPGFRFWSGATCGVTVSEIRWEDGVIKFNISGLSEDTVPPGISNVTIETFTDAAILHFESERLFEGKAVIEWGRAGDKTESFVTEAYAPGKYAILLEGLQPDNKTYNVTLTLESNEKTGESRTVSFMTRKSPAVSWPYIYMNGVERNSDGTIPYGSPLPLRASNASNAAEIHWTYNGRPIEVEVDKYYKVKENGTLKARIIWKDGTEDTIIKEIILGKEE